jgi:transposase
VEVAAVPPDADGLRGLAWQVGELGQPVRAAIDPMAATWFPRSGCRPQGCGRAGKVRFRLHLVRHRTALKNRVHATLLAFGKPCTASDLFGADAEGCFGGWGCRSHGRARWWLL